MVRGEGIFGILAYLDECPRMNEGWAYCPHTVRTRRTRLNFNAVLVLALYARAQNTKITLTLFFIAFVKQIVWCCRRRNDSGDLAFYINPRPINAICFEVCTVPIQFTRQLEAPAQGNLLLDIHVHQTEK